MGHLDAKRGLHCLDVKVSRGANQRDPREVDVECEVVREEGGFRSTGCERIIRRNTAAQRWQLRPVSQCVEREAHTFQHALDAESEVLVVAEVRHVGPPNAERVGRKVHCEAGGREIPHGAAVIPAVIQCAEEIAGAQNGEWLAPLSKVVRPEILEFPYHLKVQLVECTCRAEAIFGVDDTHRYADVFQLVENVVT